MERFDYFKTIEDKYKNRYSTKKPLVIRLDGRGVTKNKGINLLSLKEDFKDEGIEITSTYPVSYHDNTLDNLKAAASGENEEWTVLYPEFAKEAREEGFSVIATAYERIAEVEKNHEKRYKKLINNLQNHTVFKKEESVLWMCTNCGYIYEGKEAPKSCPACLHPQGYFKVYNE